MTKIEALRLELAAREMVEGTGLEWWEVLKWDTGVAGIHCALRDKPQLLLAKNDYFKLALGIVEGKPVWNGDTLWHPTEGAVLANDNWGKELFNHNGKVCYIEHLSWNPPKPKTMAVELSYEAVQYFAKQFTSSTTIGIHNSVIDACRKALEEAK